MDDPVDKDKIYDDLHDSTPHNAKKVFKKKTSCKIKTKKSIQIPSSSLSEAALEKNEVDLYRDLIIIEENEKADKEKQNAELENLKQKIEKLEELQASKDSRISELVNENANLKRNICSLYKTSKAEIERKDSLLTEANKKLDNRWLRRNGQSFESDKFERTSNYSRKTLACPVTVDSEQNTESVEKSSKLVQTEETASNNFLFRLLGKNVADPNKIDSNRTAPNSSFPGEANLCGQSRDTTETSNVFFTLLSDHLKQSFIEYEQSQIISLNRLKQSFVNQYISCDTNPPSPSNKCDQSLVNASFSQILLDKESQDASSVNTSSLLTPSTTHKTETGRHRGGETPTSSISTRTESKSHSSRVRTYQQRGMTSKFHYQRERQSFNARRKYEHDKRGLVPKRIL